MTKVLIIGVTGTLGHKIAQELSKNKKFIIHGTFTNKSKLIRIKKFLKKTKFHKAEKITEITRLINNKSFKYVINCSGIIKQKKESKKKIYSINKIYPQRIANLAEKLKFKFIHFSTDCVFNGKRGNYLEKSTPNSKDIYGRSKAAGEPLNNKQSLIFRTSFIGHEIKGNYSLLNWLLSSKKKVNGYSKCYFNGLTNIEISKFINQIIKKNLFQYGLFHLGGRTISKYKLLKKINKIYKLKKIIYPASKPKINRTLNNNKLKKKFKFKSKTWDKLLKDLYSDYNKNYTIYKS